MKYGVRRSIFTETQPEDKELAMNKRFVGWLSVGVACCLCITMSGCATYGEAAGLGATLGAVTGGIIGHQSGHAIEGAVIGGLAGAAAGLIAQDIKERRARSAQETVVVYNYNASQGEVLRLERCEVLPTTVRPGETAEAEIQYALLGTGAGVTVTEQRTLMRGDRVIADVSTVSFTRDDGTWVSSQPFRVPTNLEPGLYTIVTSVRTAKSAISAQAQFNVL